MPKLGLVLSRRIVIIGTGGHSRVVAELAFLAGYETAGFLEPKDEGATHHEGLPVFRFLPHEEAFWVVSAIGDNTVRNRVVNRINVEINESDSEWAPALIHPSATVSASASLDQGTTVHAGSLVGPKAQVGRHCIVNSRALVEHDCQLEHFSSLAPAAVMGGASRLCEGAFLGMNATLLQGRSIGAWSIVGAGSLVLSRVSDNRLVFGTPARDHRPISSGDSPFGSSEQ